MKVRNRLASCPCRPLLAPFYLYKLFVFFQTSETRTFVGEQASLNEEKKKEMRGQFVGTRFAITIKRVAQSSSPRSQDHPIAAASQ